MGLKLVQTNNVGFDTFKSRLRALWLTSAGQDLIEYALIAGMIAVLVGSMMPGAADQITTILSKVNQVVVSAGNDSPHNL